MEGRAAQVLMLLLLELRLMLWVLLLWRLRLTLRRIWRHKAMDQVLDVRSFVVQAAVGVDASTPGQASLGRGCGRLKVWRGDLVQFPGEKPWFVQLVVHRPGIR